MMKTLISVGGLNQKEKFMMKKLFFAFFSIFLCCSLLFVASCMDLDEPVKEKDSSSQSESVWKDENVDLSGWT